MENPALLVIDVQKGLDDPSHGERNNPGAEANIALLLAEWRKRGLPVIHVKHNSVEPGSMLAPGLPGNAVKEEAEPLPGEKQFSKTVGSAFIGTGLPEYLKDRGIDTLVLVGLTTDHCISATARMAGDMGFGVTVVSDATAAHGRKGYDGVEYTGEQIHRISLVSLQDEFARVVPTARVLAELSPG